MSYYTSLDAGLPAPARFCASCGAGLPAPARFCASCGAPVERNIAETPRLAAARLTMPRRERVTDPMLDQLGPYPAFSQRVGAWLIDYALIMVFLFIFAVAGVPWLLPFFPILVALYFLLCEGSNQGQTAGKQACGLRVVSSADGQPLSAERAFGRLFARVTDVFGIGLLWAAFDPYGRAFHDHLARTVVVDAAKFPAPGKREADAVAGLPTPPAGTPESWRRDPSGRHSLRWWNGTQWTRRTS